MGVISYIMSLGASVMMPIIFFIFGLLLGMGPGKSLKSGLSVGVGFVGLSVVTQLLADNLGPAVNSMVKIYNLHLHTLDIGWPAASTVAFGTEVGAVIIPLGLGINILMLLTKTTETLNIDLWNYWHFAFIGSLVAIATKSVLWGMFAAIITIIVTLVGADRSQKKVEQFYGKDLSGISIPQAFCVSFIPFAIAINWVIDKIPGLNKVDFDAEKLQKKFGILGDPILLGGDHRDHLRLLSPLSIRQSFTIRDDFKCRYGLDPKNHWFVHRRFESDLKTFARIDQQAFPRSFFQYWDDTSFGDRPSNDFSCFTTI